MFISGLVMVTHTCSPNTWEVEAGGLLVQGQLDCLEIPCLEKQNKTKQKDYFCSPASS
jgi:hypothetical protein